MGTRQYQEFYRRSVEHPEEFWAEQARAVDWQKPWDKVLDYDRPPFARWFVGGETNLCFNAVDRHLAERGDQNALIYASTETDERKNYTYRELYAEVNRFAAVLKDLGVGRGDRVVIYMPMTAEAIFAMLACVRLGAIHVVVFGGFAPNNLATRIDSARPKVLLTADAGMRGGKVIPYKPLVDEALSLAEHPVETVLVCNRNLDESMPKIEGRDLDYGALGERYKGVEVPVEWVESSEPSYILHTSGTTGVPKGVQRDTGGYLVALAASMRHVFTGKPGETMLTTSDVGWVVGHSYMVYAPLIHGMATIVYEGLPTRPDPGIWWRLVEEYGVTTMFSAPTAIRSLEKQDPKYLTAHDTSSLTHIFLAGEPLDAPTSRWIFDSLNVKVVDNYWQTETGWPILCPRQPGLDDMPTKAGSAGFPCYGYDVKLVHEVTGQEVGHDERGILTITPPLPPGCLSTLWDNDERFVNVYFSDFGERLYSTFDWAKRDEEGYYFVLGRSDDVINVAGHRLGTREIEEAIMGLAEVTEVAAVGVKDEAKGQVIFAYVVPRDASTVSSEDERMALQASVSDKVVAEIGSVARPAAVHFVTALPKTRSGKLLRRSIQAISEGRDPGDTSTVEDPSALDDIRRLREGGAANRR